MLSAPGGRRDSGMPDVSSSIRTLDGFELRDMLLWTFECCKDKRRFGC